MDNMKYRITLELGDYSGDGHNITDARSFSCNVDYSEIEKAYNNSVKVIGVDLIEECCVECDDNSISDSHYEKMARCLEKGPLDKLLGIGKEYPWFGAVEYCELFWMYVQYSNPEIVYKKVDNMHIGGYGLYAEF
jgi:hypothetical protein